MNYFPTTSAQETTQTQCRSYEYFSGRLHKKEKKEVNLKYFMVSKFLGYSEKYIIYKIRDLP